MSDFRIIITGGRKQDSEDDYARMVNIMVDIGEYWCRAVDLVIIQGGCPDGVDALARRFAREYGVPLESFPADWARYGRAAGPKRNQLMADAGAGLCLAFPSRGRSSGTWDMIRRAVAAGIDTRIYPEAAS